MSEPSVHTKATNRLAIISFAAGLLTLSAFCIAVVPVPFTGYVCFPGAAILGPIALVTGLVAIRQAGARSEKGRGLALIGAIVGGLTLLAMLCVAAAGIMLWPRIAELIRGLMH